MVRRGHSPVGPQPSMSATPARTRRIQPLEESSLLHKETIMHGHDRTQLYCQLYIICQIHASLFHQHMHL